MDVCNKIIIEANARGVLRAFNSPQTIKTNPQFQVSLILRRRSVYCGNTPI